MPRAKYRITADDCLHASFYLSNQLRNYGIELNEEFDADDVQREFREASSGRRGKEQAKRLNAWAEQYLSTAEWVKLKAAIRKRRQRWENYGEEKTVSISAKAHELLSKIAERDCVTYSEVLENCLAKAWRSSRSTANARRRPR